MPKKRKRSADNSDDDTDDDYIPDDEELQPSPSRRKAPPNADLTVSSPANNKSPSGPTGDSTTSSSDDGGPQNNNNDNKSFILSDSVAARRRKKRIQSRKNNDNLSDEEDEDDDIDTSHRLTVNGGYAHTMKSKLRISKANKGKSPWNKGGQRSAADKAKISEGVRARNRAILLEKLKLLGLTEDEWIQKKKEIKYLRERVRKARAANNAKALAEQETLLQSALAATELKDEQKEAATINYQMRVARKENLAATKAMQGKIKQPKTPAKAPVVTTSHNHSQAESTTHSEEKKESDAQVVAAPKQTTAAVPSVVPGAKLPDVFVRDIRWRYHEFDASARDSPYDQVCPYGGPGGLICCVICTRNYSAFLTGTSKDIEEQKTHKVNKEVKELLGFLTDARSRLDEALRLAKNQSRYAGNGWQRRVRPPQQQTPQTQQKQQPGRQAQPQKKQPPERQEPVQQKQEPRKPEQTQQKHPKPKLLQQKPPAQKKQAVRKQQDSQKAAKISVGPRVVLPPPTTMTQKPSGNQRQQQQKGPTIAVGPRVVLPPPTVHDGRLSSELLPLPTPEWANDAPDEVIETVAV